MKEIIRLADLTTGYPGKPVTRGITASLRSGELTCLLGPNGAGKSTLLKTLCTFIPPLGGSISIFDEDLRSYSARRLARILGVVLTERPSGMNMTVEDLVAIGRSPYTSFLGGLKSADRDVVAEAIERVGIEDLRNRRVHTLSDGERQKVMIAKTLAQQTDVIFLDEPTAFLDFPSKVEIMKLLYRLAHEEEKTVFLSTHDIELALQLSDRLWLLDKSRGLHIGTPSEVSSTGVFADYFNRPGLTFDPASQTFRISKS